MKRLPVNNDKNGSMGIVGSGDSRLNISSNRLNSQTRLSGVSSR